MGDRLGIPGAVGFFLLGPSSFLSPFGLLPWPLAATAGRPAQGGCLQTLPERLSPWPPDPWPPQPQHRGPLAPKGRPAARAGGHNAAFPPPRHKAHPRLRRDCGGCWQGGAILEGAQGPDAGEGVRTGVRTSAVHAGRGQGAGLWEEGGGGGGRGGGGGWYGAGSPREERASSPGSGSFGGHQLPRPWVPALGPGPGPCFPWPGPRAAPSSQANRQPPRPPPSRRPAPRPGLRRPQPPPPPPPLLSSGPGLHSAQKGIPFLLTDNLPFAPGAARPGSGAPDARRPTALGFPRRRGHPAPRSVSRAQRRPQRDSLAQQDRRRPTPGQERSPGTLPPTPHPKGPDQRKKPSQAPRPDGVLGRNGSGTGRLTPGLQVLGLPGLLRQLQGATT